MPLDKEAMREYQRKRRGQVDKAPAITADHEHYWQRLQGADQAVCTSWLFGHRQIGGCGEVRAYTGKGLPAFDMNDWVAVIGRLPARQIDRMLAVPGPINTGKKPMRDAP